MRLTSFTDYSFRVLLFAAANRDRLVTISEVRNHYKISHGHLLKVINGLKDNGFLESIRGRSGGLKLAMPPEKIILGNIVRVTEPDFKLIECFGDQNKCMISERCKLPGPLNEALNAFLTVLDQYTLADMMLNGLTFSSISSKPFPIRGPKI